MRRCLDIYEFGSDQYHASAAPINTFDVFCPAPYRNRVDRLRYPPRLHTSSLVGSAPTFRKQKAWILPGAPLNALFVERRGATQAVLVSVLIIDFGAWRVVGGREAQARRELPSWCESWIHTRLRLQPALVHRTAIHNAQAPGARGHHPILQQIYFSYSSLFPTPPAFECLERLRTEFVREGGIGLCVRHINQAQISACLGLSNRHPRALARWSIFNCGREHLFNFVFRDAVIVNMRLAGLLIPDSSEAAQHNSSPRLFHLHPMRLRE